MKSSRGPSPALTWAYGGQALIEGVMIRGRHHFSLAVRRPSGDIFCFSAPLHPIYTGRARRFPLLRGMVVLMETLVLGVQALNRSANIAFGLEGRELPPWLLGLNLLFALGLAIGLFFLAPLLGARSLDLYIASDLVSNLVEGLIRLGIFLGYVKLLSYLPQVKRTFAYHGAEHMVVHAFEQGTPLEIGQVRSHPTAHPRCGTAFLLVVMVIAILVFSLFGRPSLGVGILTRVALVPLIGAISYEVIRFGGTHSQQTWVRLLLLPGLLLQKLTTRKPDDPQIEVAIRAMKATLDADEAALKRDLPHSGVPQDEASTQG